MLLEFTVENFRSIRDEQRLSLVAGPIDEMSGTHVATTPDGEHLLRSAVIYGPNASGKSNLLAALAAMQRFVLRSARRTRGDAIEEAEPFRLDATSRDRPTTFDVTFLAEGVRYQYGFSVTASRVEAEWLYSFPKRRHRLLFDRGYDGDDEVYEFGEHLPGQKVVYRDATRPNALFLSTAVQLNSEALAPVFDWFGSKLEYTDSHRIRATLPTEATLRRCASDAGRERVVQLLRAADVGIHDLVVDEEETHELALTLDLSTGQTTRSAGPGRRTRVRFRHEGAADDEPFDLADESLGTRRLFALSGRLLDVLEHGRVLVADELGSSLHPLILRSIVSLFLDPDTNPHGAQLVFATHETNLLDQGFFRRDQVWFTEKGPDGSTSLTSLYEFRPRKGVEPLEKNYLKGRYGALPMPRLPRAVSGVSRGSRDPAAGGADAGT
jgi:hypothetical protein